MSSLVREKEEALEEGKYAKARRQSRGGLVVVLTVVMLIIFVASHMRHKRRESNTDDAALRASHEAYMKEINTTGSLAVIGSVKKKPKMTMAQLQKTVELFDTKVRAIKREVDIFETDPNAQAAAKKLQDATRELLKARYGVAEPYRVHVELEFQETIPDFADNGKDGSFTIELAPSRLVPHSIYTFLEIARQWKGGAFHRIANHVLQVMVKTTTIQHLAFQEYSSEFPHKERTVGYAGRPSGPAWYVSIADNSRNHGPGSQQKHNPYEADACIGRVIQGYEESVLRIRKVPGSGFLGDAKKHVIIKKMTILVPKSKDSSVYVEWKETKQDEEEDGNLTEQY